MKISGFTAWLIEVDPGPRFVWRNGLPGSHGDVRPGRRPRKAIVRMDTDEETFGTVEFRPGEILFDMVDRRFHHFIGENPLMTERIWNLVWEVDRIEEFPMRPMGVLDILCWDVKSKRAGLPLYQLLGGNNPVVPAYASTVTWSTLEDYERHIKLCADVGFEAFKLHAWGDVKRDIELIRALRRWTGPKAALMFDGSAGWDYVDSLEIGLVLQDEGYLWYEEPMREFYLGAYAKLCDKLEIPILAAETSDGAHWNMASWIEAKALDMTRIGAYDKCGITGSMKIAATSESFGLRCQVHGMGLENAQLCAAISINDYYEQIVIDEHHIRNLDKLGPLSVVDGHLKVSDEPGVGYRYDWDEIERTAIRKVEVTERFDG